MNDDTDIASFQEPWRRFEFVLLLTSPLHVSPITHTHLMLKNWLMTVVIVSIMRVICRLAL